MKRFFQLLFSLVFCAAVLLFFYQHAILERLVTFTLAQTGAEEIRCKIGSIGLGHVDIISLSANLPVAGARIRAEQIRLQWDRSIIASRQISRVTMDSLHLFLLPGQRHHARSGAMQPTAVLRRIMSLMDSQTRLAVKHLAVDSLYPHLPALPRLDSHVFSLRLDQQNNTLRLRLSDRASALTAHLVLRPKLWTLSLGRAKTPSWFQATIRKHNGLSWLAHLELAHLDQMASLVDLPFLPLQGTLTMSGSLTPASHPDLLVDASLDRIRYRDISLDKGRVRLSGRLYAGHLTLDSKSLLRLQTLRDKKTSLAGLELPLAAELRWGKDFSLHPVSGQWLRLDGLSGPTFSLAGLTLALPAHIGYAQGQIQLEMNGRGSHTLTGVEVSRFKAKRLAIAETGPYSLLMDTSAGTPCWRLDPGRWVLSMAPLEKENIKIITDPLTVAINALYQDEASEPQLKATVQGPSLHIGNKKNGLWLRELNLELETHHRQLQIHASMRLPPFSGLLEMNGNHDLVNHTGTLNIKTRKPLTLSPATPLSRIADTWPLPGDLTSGALSFLVKTSWPQARTTASLRLKNGCGTFQKLSFSGLDTDLRLALLPGLKTLAPARITIRSIRGPVELSDLVTTLRIRAGQGPLPAIILENSRVELMGGSLENKKLRLDLNRPEVDTVVVVEGLHLEDLLALQQVKGLSVSGVVSGKLPIRYDKNGLHIEQGILKNLPPGGIIRYIPKDAAGLQSSPLTDIALKALEEFHYKLLSATAAYQPDGTLRVSLHLEGSGPKLDTRRPVHLNINTEQNILSLLKSLRYSDALTKEIDKRIENHIRPEKPLCDP